jgi:sec-independent protein translocase protein TatA
MFGMGYQELLVVLVVVLVLFGGAKIPELMRGVGKGISEFKNGVEEAKRPLQEALRDDEKR